ncbi:MAG: sulfatase [Planctomycetota bacterium]
MRCVIAMFDSLNRHFLQPYGCDWTCTPNFQRLAATSVQFQRCYVGSMPCMPARAEFHSGRHNFFHNGWCPMEPWMQSLPELLRERGVYSHISTDHYHYWEDAGTGYHTRYDSFDAIRGQEGDAWIGQVADPEIPATINGKGRRQDWVNRPYVRADAEHYQTRTIDAGLGFIDRNAADDDWLLHIECFDPHEPFWCDPHWKDPFPDDYDGPLFDWPGYREVAETPEQIAHIRNNYAALLRKCDHSLGRILEAFDRHDLWRDTMLVVWTDHGFLLGEHGWWAKNRPPLFEEISHTPCFIWDPRHPDAAGQHREALVQPCVDLAPTLLRFFGGEPTPAMVAGRDLEPVIASDQPVREVATFGYFGKGINVTDGRHVLYQELVHPEETLHEYSLVNVGFRRGERGAQAMRQASIVGDFTFTGGFPLLRIPTGQGDLTLGEAGTSWLYDVEADPTQQQHLDDPTTVEALLDGARRIMQAHEAPPELYRRFGMRE